ncbi:MAG TPA: hypothetical protein VLE24_07465, partial [Methyloceanibacter sp.]|nr:hypothetical protein [Methyloceanibacter sp.]
MTLGDNQMPREHSQRQSTSEVEKKCLQSFKHHMIIAPLPAAASISRLPPPFSSKLSRNKWDDLKAERGCRRLDFARLRHPAGIVSVDHGGQPTQLRERLAQDFEALGGKIGCQ